MREAPTNRAKRRNRPHSLMERIRASVALRWRAWLPALALIAVPLWAQDVTVNAFVDRAEVAPNQLFVLTLEISGSGGRLSSDPVLPDMDAFAAFLGSGSSQQIQIVNGRTSVSTTLQYRFQATAEGRFEIGPVAVTLGGKTYRTDPIPIVITPGAATPPAGAGAAAPGGEAGITDEDLFLRATSDRRRVYQNEPVVVEYKIYTRVNVTSYSVTQAPGAAGFWMEEFPLPQSLRTEVEVVDGRRYAVATLKKVALFPQGTGTKTVEPMTIETQVRSRTRSRDPFDNFFRSGGLFGRTVPHLVASPPVSVEVLPLPAAGRPHDFTGLVGTLQVTASVDDREVEANQPLTLTVRVSGTGNIRTLPAPEIAFPADFEVYPPETSEQIERADGRIGGRRTYAYVLIPRAPGRKAIPPIRMSFFDPGRGVYDAAETRPIEIEVTGDPVSAPVVAARGRGEIRTLREDIRFIHTQPLAFHPVGGKIFDWQLHWFALLIPLAAVGGAWAVRRRVDRLAGDVAYARHRRANRVARRRLGAARALATTDSTSRFYGEVQRALLGFLGDKLNMAEAGLLRDAVAERLRARGVAQTVVEGYFDCLDRCDLQRFSPAASDVSEMRAFLERAESAMSALDAALSR